MFIKNIYNIGKNELYPICRSITGNGIRKSLKIIKNYIPKLKIHKISSGTKVYDWKIPYEWNIQDAYIIDKYNRKIINFKKNNLHLVNYSIPVNKVLKKKDLFKHIHSLPKQPKAIPYITSYYKRYWGFCISHDQKLLFDRRYKNNDKFKVVVKSSFDKKGVLNYGEILIPGRSKEEIFISTYLCHPSMANNELSGPMVAMCLIKYFQKYKNLEKSIRFIFIPETIGSIAYLSKNLSYLKKNVIGGYNLSCIGDERQYSCLLTKYKNTLSDFALIEAFKKLKLKYKIYSFLERGSDERQYNSPGIDLPIASIFRTKYGRYPEYHTSLDNFHLVTEKGIRGGFKVARKAIEILLKKTVPKNIILCEPQMSKRGLYPTLSTKRTKQIGKKYMDFLQYSDGKNDLKSISKILNISNVLTKKIYYKLKKNNLII